MPPGGRRSEEVEKKDRKRSGGAEGIRTLDPHVANVVLSQLSYCPTVLPVAAYCGCLSCLLRATAGARPGGRADGVS